MDKRIEQINGIVERPLNQQVVLLKDEAAATSTAGLYISEGAKAKFKSGVIVAAAADCANTGLVPGVRVGYQRHAGADMAVVADDGEKLNIVVMNEGSLTMILKNNARLDGGE